MIEGGLISIEVTYNKYSKKELKNLLDKSLIIINKQIVNTK